MIDKWIYNFFAGIDKVAEWMDNLIFGKKKKKK